MVTEIPVIFNCFLRRIPGFPNAYAEKSRAATAAPTYLSYHNRAFTVNDYLSKTSVFYPLHGKDRTFL